MVKRIKPKDLDCEIKVFVAGPGTGTAMKDVPASMIHYKETETGRKRTVHYAPDGVAYMCSAIRRNRRHNSTFLLSTEQNDVTCMFCRRDHGMAPIEKPQIRKHLKLMCLGCGEHLKEATAFCPHCGKEFGGPRTRALTLVKRLIAEYQEEAGKRQKNGAYLAMVEHLNKIKNVVEDIKE